MFLGGGGFVDTAEQKYMEYYMALFFFCFFFWELLITRFALLCFFFGPEPRFQVRGKMNRRRLAYLPRFVGGVLACLGLEKCIQGRTPHRAGQSDLSKNLENTVTTAAVAVAAVVKQKQPHAKGVNDSGVVISLYASSCTAISHCSCCWDRQQLRRNEASGEG